MHVQANSVIVAAVRRSMRWITPDVQAAAANGFRRGASWGVVVVGRRGALDRGLRAPFGAVCVGAQGAGASETHFGNQRVLKTVHVENIVVCKRCVF